VPADDGPVLPSSCSELNCCRRGTRSPQHRQAQCHVVPLALVIMEIRSVRARRTSAMSSEPSSGGSTELSMTILSTSARSASSSPAWFRHCWIFSSARFRISFSSPSRCPFPRPPSADKRAAHSLPVAPLEPSSLSPSARRPPDSENSGTEALSTSDPPRRTRSGCKNFGQTHPSRVSSRAPVSMHRRCCWTIGARQMLCSHVGRRARYGASAKSIVVGRMLSRPAAATFLTPYEHGIGRIS
jgi:hypothetical protein